MTKQVRQLDRVVIRFAGDSGDGMQLTGDRFTSETAQLGNDISTLPNFPAEIRAPAGTLPGVSSFQVHFAELRHPHPGRLAERPGRDEPGGAEGQPARPAARRGDHRQHRRVHQAQPRQGRLREQPAGGRLAQRLRAAPGRVDQHDRQGAGRPRDLQEGRRAGQEHVRARPAVVDVLPAVRVDAGVPGAQVRLPARRWPPRTSPRSRPAGTSARPPRTSRVRYEVKPAKMPPATTATSPATRRSRWASWPPACESRLPVFLGAYPITPASDILHELCQAQEVRRDDDAGRGRDRRDRRGTGRLVRRCARASPRPPVRASHSRARRSRSPSRSNCRW